MLIEKKIKKKNQQNLVTKSLTSNYLIVTDLSQGTKTKPHNLHSPFSLPLSYSISGLRFLMFSFHLHLTPSQCLAPVLLSLSCSQHHLHPHVAYVASTLVQSAHFCPQTADLALTIDVDLWLCLRNATSSCGPSCYFLSLSILILFFFPSIYIYIFVLLSLLVG